MTDVLLTHGWAEAGAGKHTVFKLRPYIEAAGHNVTEYSYGFRLLVSTRNDRWAKELAARTTPGCALIAFSNGAAVARRATAYTDNVDTVILIRPALDWRLPWGVSVAQIHILHSQYDPALVAVPWMMRINPWAKASEWDGRLGRFGYPSSGPDNRFFNHDTSYGPRPSRTHLDIFIQPRLEYWGKQIAALIPAGS